MGAELFHADGLTKLIFVFRNCANAAKNDNAMLVHSLVKVTTRIHRKGQVQLILHHAMKAHRTEDVQFHSFWSSDLDEDEWSTAGPGRFTPKKEPWHPLNSNPHCTSTASRRCNNAAVSAWNDSPTKLITTSEDLTAVLVLIQDFWDVALCPLKTIRRKGGLRRPYMLLPVTGILNRAR